MTLASDNRVTAEYTADGTQIQFTYDFPIFFSDESKGLQVRFVNSTGFDIIDTGDYIVVQNTENTGGYIQFSTAPISGKIVQIVGNTPIDQQLEIANQSRFDPESIETNFDKIVAILQEWFQRLSDEEKMRIANDLALKNRIDATDLNLATEIANRIQGDINLQNQITSNDSDIAQIKNIISEAINNGSSPNLAVFSVNSVSDLDDLKTWENRTVYVKDMGMYRYSISENKWFWDLITAKQVIAVENTNDLLNLDAWESRTVYVKGVGVYRYSISSNGWLREEVSGTANFKVLDDLRKYEPQYEFQVVNVQAHSENINYGMSLGGGDFIYLPALSADKFKDDNGTIVVTTNSKVWIRKDLFTSKDHSIHAEWFGCDGTFYTDDTAKITSAVNACLFWRNVGTLDGKYKIGGLNSGKTTLIMPKQWYIKSTVYINMTYITVDYNNGIGLISSNGTYDKHPLLTDYKMGLAFVGKVLDGLDFVPAYYSNQIAKNGSLIYGDTDSTGSIGRFPLNESKMIACSYYGVTETIRSAVGTIDNVSYSCFGVGYTNGDFGWGYTHNDCKFDQCYDPFILVGAKDNGEKITHANCMAFNCGTLGNINTWGGDFQWLGGSWDYPNIKGLSLGTGEGNIICKIGRIEYNPCAINCLIDGSNTTSSCVLSDAFLLFAAPETSTSANNSIFKSSYDNQFKFSDSRIIDHSASASLTQNQKIGNGFKVITDNIKSLTLFDYFLTKSCVNAVGVGSWTVVNASDYLTYAVDDSKQTLTIMSSATTAQEQVINVFVPLRNIKRFTDASGIVTATKPDVGLNVVFSMGYLDKAGALHTSYYLDDNSGQAFNFNNGVSFPYGVYGSTSIAKHFKHDQGVNYTEQGMILRFNMFNLIKGVGKVVIDASATGAVTL
ncbi:MAG: hypothetical protein [Bacteriophage sp.]|nr:MAG: hypothetical protein [Bacteriophage sp.]